MNENISKLKIALTSPAFYSLVALGVYNLLAFLVPQLDGTTQVIANGILMVLTMYLHPKEVQKAGNTQ